MRKYAELTRTRVSAFASMTALTGYVAGSGGLDSGALMAALGVFLLASGASALNQVTEQDTDSLMRRTMLRPLPTGTIRRAKATTLSVLLVLSGLLVLGTAGPVPAALGLLATLIYNGIYTPLKKRTGLAILVGAIAGAMPPAIGWAMVGSGPVSPVLLAICLLLYLWQMPHFWMILMRHREDFMRAGLPTPGRHLSNAQIKRICLTWVAATSAAGLMLPLLGSGTGSAALALMLAATALLLVTGLLAFSNPARREYFVNSNIYIILIMLSIVFGSVHP